MFQFYIEYEYLDDGDVKYGEFNPIAPDKESACYQFWNHSRFRLDGYDFCILACYNMGEVEGGD